MFPVMKRILNQLEKYKMSTVKDKAELRFLDEMEKTALFIDGVSTHAVARNLGWVIDFRRLREFFAKETHLVKAYYFTPMDVQDTVQISSLIEWLGLNGFICELVEFDSADERGKRTSIDVPFVTECLSLAFLPNAIDHIILFTGAGKYVPLVRRLDKLAKKVTICSTTSIKTENSDRQMKMVSHDLRKAADHFLDLETIREYVERKDDTRR